jgi:hypothetical protein
MKLRFPPFFFRLPLRMVLLSFLIHTAVALVAQTENPFAGVEIKTHYAFLMPHHEHMLMLNQQNFPILQISFFRDGDHGFDWQKLYRFPPHGISMVWSPLSSPDYIGQGFAVMPFVNFYLIKKKKFSTSFFAGTGLGYISKPFDIRENYKNQAIGSRFNAAMMGQLEMRYRISDQISLSCGSSLTHFSNGKVKTPNLGINNVGFFVGYSQYFPVKENTREAKEVDFYKNTDKWEKNIFVAAAVKQNYPVGGKSYLYTDYSFNVKRVFSQKGKFGAGIDIFYDFSDKAHFEMIGYDEPAIQYTKPAIYGLYDFRLGRTSIFLHVGTYLYAYRKNQDVGMIYDRVGIQVYLSENISALVALKTHYAKADCIEWALNYSF